MKILRWQRPLLFCLSLLFFASVHAQLPTVTAQVGYPMGRPASQVAYGNSRYVLLTTYNYNQIFQSATGTSWNAVSASGLTTSQLNFLAYGAGVFVVVGNGGVIQTSADGINWVSRTSGTTSDLIKVYFVNSKFFAIGNNRTVLSSTDGISWNTIAFNVGSSTDSFMSLTYGNDCYVLNAWRPGGSTAIVYRSPSADDNSWALSPATFPGKTINRIQFLKDRFWAFFSSYDMFTSTDGASWTDITSSIVLQQPDNSVRGWGTGHQIFNGIWDGTQFNFYGSSFYYGGYGSTFTSTDGIHFTLLNKTAYIVPQQSSLINGLYLICGNEGIVSSSDRITYSYPGYSFNSLVKTAGKYVGVGAISGDGQIYTSSDFTNWTTASPANIRELYSAAFDGTQLLAGGYTGVYRSTNEGDSWSKVYNDLNETFYSMAYGNGRFVSGGYNSDLGSFLRYSTDGGTTWTNTSTLNISYLKVKYVNNRFFALGTDNDTFVGRILYSTDGITWTDVTPSLGFDVYYFKDVAFDGTKYHVYGVDLAGSFFTVSTSTPDNAASYGNKAVCSNTPAGVTLGGVWEEGVLDYSEGRFTGAVIDATTGQDYIITSTDGSSWTALPQNSYSTISGSYVNGATVQMVGKGNALFTVSNSTALPVRLLSFSGKLYESAVQLQWSTATEVEAQQFTVQHSTDGMAWKSIGTIKAAGNSTVRQDYQFLHTNPIEGTNFYRLLQQDRDGKTTYSHVVAVQYGQALKASWYPNPVTDQLTIRTTSNRPGTLTLLNASGQPVKRTSMAGYETLVNMTGLPAGIYIADIRQGSQQRQIRVVKN